MGDIFSAPEHAWPHPEQDVFFDAQNNALVRTMLISGR